MVMTRHSLSLMFSVTIPTLNSLLLKQGLTTCKSIELCFHQTPVIHDHSADSMTGCWWAASGRYFTTQPLHNTLAHMVRIKIIRHDVQYFRICHHWRRGAIVSERLCQYMGSHGQESRRTRRNRPWFQDHHSHDGLRYQI